MLNPHLIEKLYREVWPSYDSTHVRGQEQRFALLCSLTKTIERLQRYPRLDTIVLRDNGVRDVKTDFGGKRVNFDDAVKHLKEFLPSPADPARGVKVTETIPDGMPTPRPTRRE